MPIQKTVGEQRTLVNYNALETTFGQEVLICVDVSILAIMAKLLNHRGRWATTYYVSLGQGFYVTPDDVQMAVLNELIDDFLVQLGDIDMLCESLISTLQNLNNTFQQLGAGGGCGACQGTGGAGVVAAPPAPFVDDGGNFPAGYANRTEYITNKCDLVEYVLDQIASDLANVRTLDLVGLTLASIIGGLGVALLTPIPFDDIIGLGAALVTIIATLGAASAVLAEAKSWVDNLDRCIPFLADDATSAVTDIHAAIDAASFPVGGDLTRDVLKKFFTTDSLNILFEEMPPLINLPDGDCSTCGSVCVVTWDYILSAEGWTWTDESTGSSTAVGTHDPVKEALQSDHVLASEPNVSSVIRWTSPVSAQDGLVANDGDYVEVVIDAASDALETQCTVVLTYDDDTSDVQVSVGINQRIVQVNAAPGSPKVIKSIHIDVARSTDALAVGSTFSAWVLRTILDLSASPECL